MAPTCATLSTKLLPGLDWRPLTFEDPLPSNWVCQVCGLVCKKTAVLHCSHTLCNVCFEASVALGGVCPVDGEVFHPDDVGKVRLRPGQLLKLRVSCWNVAHGCSFVGPVFEFLDHFEKECVYHNVSCHRCNQDVPRRNLVQHRVSGCEPTRSAKAAPSDVTYLGGQLTEALDKASAEIKQSIAELKDSYNELQASVNTVADQVRRERSEAKQVIYEAIASHFTRLQATHTYVNTPGRPSVNEKESKDGDTYLCPEAQAQLQGDSVSPLNPEGRKIYDRSFLIKLQAVPMSLKKPLGLPRLNIIKGKAMLPKLPEVQRPRYLQEDLHQIDRPAGHTYGDDCLKKTVWWI
uniref:Putative tnf receptor-associated factor 6 n=1 Tax=Ixodes ricinus TaxID=34613 RepID=V5I4R5_IXORI